MNGLKPGNVTLISPNVIINFLGITNKVVPFSYNYCMNNIIIAKSTFTKYLGVTIAHNLNYWNQHCDNICSKANRMLGLLRRVLSDCSMDVKSKAYTSLVRPV